MKQQAKILTLILLFTISSCSHSIHKHPDNKPVRLIQKNELTLLTSGETPDCRYLGEIIGSEGHWYTYLFISNSDLLQGALNDLYNHANEIGANVVYVSDNIDFATSVTFYGQAYNCEYDEAKQ